MGNIASPAVPLQCCFKANKMRTRSSITALSIAIALCLPAALQAQTTDSTHTKAPRLTVGGYGEAVYSRHFYSDNMFRYSHHDRYKDAPSYGRIDLPHAVIMLGYDFGHGWTMGTEIEFEHGGIEAATERETEETGEFEQEIERGGEVALEQFWVQKSFNRHLNLRAGHIVVPVGMTNNGHLPTQFFSVYRPEGENTIMPCTWHETGISLWGRAGTWRYEAQLIPSLNSNFFNDAGWVHNGSASPYEFRPANSLAGAFRIDWTGLPGLRLSASGYIGNTFNNDITTVVYNANSRYYGAKATVLIGALDFAYHNRHLIVRGNLDYGHLGDAALVSSRNKNQTTMTGNPYPHTTVGEQAFDRAIEAGIDLLSWGRCKQRLWLFGRYDHYDSFIPAEGSVDVPWCEKHIFSAGINYYPIPEIAVKAEYSLRGIGEPGRYNNEPYIALGITWAGYFKH